MYSSIHFKISFYLDNVQKIYNKIGFIVFDTIN